ncbi:hypothetical protein [Zongyangia hominis]|uniref:CARDB domain-containing protein n=1 Tax=Zongyangia hominis TaxID=2763677 RepID=A0A926EBI9_9FIRM|nr:hypothetical protein [Zongyangia hominis]MBC8569329.1 hypothetical protein [Zongyangia hominis]
MKRCLSALVALMMALMVLFSAMPTAFAAEGGEPNPPATDTPSGTEDVFIESVMFSQTPTVTKDKNGNMTSNTFDVYLTIADYMAFNGYKTEEQWLSALSDFLESDTYIQSLDLTLSAGEFYVNGETEASLVAWNEGNYKDKFYNLDELLSKGKVKFKIKISKVQFSGTEPASLGVDVRYKFPKIDEDGTMNKGIDVMYSHSLSRVIRNVKVPNETPDDDNPNDSEEPDKEQSIPKPYLMIDSYVFGGGQAVEAGNEFSLTLNFVNTSGATLKNVMVTLDGDTSFIPVNTSSSFYIPEVKGKGRYTKVIKFYTDVSVEPKPQKVNVKMDYEYFLNDKYNEMSNAQVLTISTIQPDRFTVAKAEIPTEVYIGQETEASVTFKNMGKSDIVNISAEVQGDIQNPGQLALFDNMQAGKSDTFEFNISPLNEGVCNLKVIIKYEDAMGKQYEISQDYQTTAMAAEPGMEPMPPTDPTIGEQPEEPQKGVNFWLIGGIAVAVIIIAVVATKIIRKKLQEKREKELDDEDI